MTDAHNQPIARTRHTELTLDQIGEIQPGLGRIMPEVSDRYWVLYYAARGGNWDLARYQVGELKGLLRLASTTRPQYKPHLDAFSQGHLTGIERAIEARDFPTFQRAYRRGIEGANTYHVELGHPEIVWQLPEEPPKHLRLTLGLG